MATTPSSPTVSTSPDPVTRYARKVVDGEIVAGPYVRAACRRHLDDLLVGHTRGLTFNLERMQHALGFFPTVLRLNGGQFEGIPFVLQPAQEFIVGSLFGWVRSDGTRRFRVAYVEMGKGNGKALALDTPIATPSGWTTMGELRDGDWVFGADGKPCRVIQAHPVSTDRECYAIEFDSGERIVASAEHLWETEQRCAGKVKGASIKGVPLNARGAWRKGVRSTAEIAGTLTYANHSVRLAQPLDSGPADLPIEPYGLGVWLGDGDSDCGRITVGAQDEPEMRKALTAAGWRVGGLLPGRRIRLEGLHVALRMAGLMGRKHIPPAYLRAGVEQRRALLQGLMDSDGYISPAGQCEFCNTNEMLARQVLELACSLGFKATLNTGVATLNGRVIGPKYRVLFYPTPAEVVFRLPRKQGEVRERHSRRRLSADRRIVSCDRVPTAPVRCITVDSTDSMFLAGKGMVPTHNSPMVGGVGLYGMVADQEPRAEIYAAATKKDQAMILFRDAVAMVDQSPALSRRLKKSGRDDKVWNLFDDKTNSFFRPISADDGQSGPRPHIGLVDELHEHKTATVMNMLSAGRKWRRQPLIVAITNSGTDRKSVCWEYREKGIQVCERIADDDTLFAYICALDEGDEPLTDESCWVKANPLLGPIIDPQYLRDEVNAAKGMPSKESSVLRLNFCVWTEAHNPAISYEKWVASKAEYTLEKFRGFKGTMGLDLSATTDLTAAVLDVKIDGIHWLWPWFFIPSEGLAERSRKDGVPYDVWVKKGFVQTTPGAAIDKDFVVSHLEKTLAEYDITLEKAPYDRHRIDVLTAACARQGVEWPLEPHGQGFVSMGPAWDSFETALVENKMRQPDNPCFNSNAANAVVVSDPAGNRKLDKSKATGRIDGMVAATMAVGTVDRADQLSIQPGMEWL